MMGQKHNYSPEQNDRGHVVGWAGGWILFLGVFVRPVGLSTNLNIACFGSAQGTVCKVDI